jgi:hypothetical protein
MAVLVLAVTLAAQSRPDVLVALARDGWAAARAATRAGGSPESLAPARRDLAEIEKLTQGTVWQLQGEYARALIAAAMAAAQNEHGELDLQLSHARSLSERLATSAYPARWPVAIDDAEGELYLAVYRFGDAARAFRRAGKVREACDAYRQAAKVMTEGAIDEATAYLKTCK